MRQTTDWLLHPGPCDQLVTQELHYHMISCTARQHAPQNSASDPRANTAQLEAVGAADLAAVQRAAAVGRHVLARQRRHVRQVGGHHIGGAARQRDGDHAWTQQLRLLGLHEKGEAGQVGDGWLRWWLQTGSRLCRLCTCSLESLRRPVKAMERAGSLIGNRVETSTTRLT